MLNMDCFTPFKFLLLLLMREVILNVIQRKLINLESQFQPGNYIKLLKNYLIYNISAKQSLY